MMLISSIHALSARNVSQSLRYMNIHTKARNVANVSPFGKKPWKFSVAYAAASLIKSESMKLHKRVHTEDFKL